MSAALKMAELALARADDATREVLLVVIKSLVSELQAARALPEGVEPQVVVALYDPRATPCVLSWNTLSVGEHRLYTAAQVLAMGRVPDELTDADLSAIYKQANGEDVGKARPLTTANIFRAMRATLAAAPRPPAAQQRKPLDSVRQMVDQQKAKRDALVAKGICAECEGEGVQGGQFCGGGDWTCETCSGTGQITPEAP